MNTCNYKDELTAGRLHVYLEETVTRLQWVLQIGRLLGQRREKNKRTKLKDTCVTASQNGHGVPLTVPCWPRTHIFIIPGNAGNGSFSCSAEKSPGKQTKGQVRMLPADDRPSCCGSYV